MAVAGSQAGQVLAWPLFHGVNMHMRTLNMREVVKYKYDFTHFKYAWSRMYKYILNTHEVVRISIS